MEEQSLTLVGKGTENENEKGEKEKGEKEKERLIKKKERPRVSENNPLALPITEIPEEMVCDAENCGLNHALSTNADWVFDKTESPILIASLVIGLCEKVRYNGYDAKVALFVRSYIPSLAKRIDTPCQKAELIIRVARLFTELGERVIWRDEAAHILFDRDDTDESKPKRSQKTKEIPAELCGRLAILFSETEPDSKRVKLWLGPFFQNSIDLDENPESPEKYENPENREKEENEEKEQEKEKQQKNKGLKDPCSAHRIVAAWTFLERGLVEACFSILPIPYGNGFSVDPKTVASTTIFHSSEESWVQRMKMLFAICSLATPLLSTENYFDECDHTIVKALAKNLADVDSRRTLIDSLLDSKESSSHVCSQLVAILLHFGHRRDAMETALKASLLERDPYRLLKLAKMVLPRTPLKQYVENRDGTTKSFPSPPGEEALEREILLKSLKNAVPHAKDRVRATQSIVSSGLFSDDEDIETCRLLLEPSGTDMISVLDNRRCCLSNALSDLGRQSGDKNPDAREKLVASLMNTLNEMRRQLERSSLLVGYGGHPPYWVEIIEEQSRYGYLDEILLTVKAWRRWRRFFSFAAEPVDPQEKKSQDEKQDTKKEGPKESLNENTSKNEKEEENDFGGFSEESSRGISKEKTVRRNGLMSDSDMGRWLTHSSGMWFMCVAGIMLASVVIISRDDIDESRSRTDFVNSEKDYPKNSQNNNDLEPFGSEDQMGFDIMVRDKIVGRGFLKKVYRKIKNMSFRTKKEEKDKKKKKMRKMKKKDEKDLVCPEEKVCKRIEGYRSFRTKKVRDKGIKLLEESYEMAVKADPHFNAMGNWRSHIRHVAGMMSLFSRVDNIFQRYPDLRDHFSTSTVDMNLVRKIFDDPEQFC